MLDTDFGFRLKPLRPEIDTETEHIIEKNQYRKLKPKLKSAKIKTIIQKQKWDQEK